MAIREDERALRTNDDLQYCVICKRYLSPIAWREHEHNPAIQKARNVSALEALMGDVVYLGPVKVSNCASVVVIQGVEVFRLRDRSGSNALVVDLDLRGPKDERIAFVQGNQAMVLGPGHHFEADGPVCRVLNGETEVVRVEALDGKGVAIQGVLRGGGLEAVMTGSGLTVGGVVISEPEVRGKGTAILLRKKAPMIGFANR